MKSLYSLITLSLIFFASNLYSAEHTTPILDWKGWLTIVVFILTIYALIREICPPDITMLISASSLVIFGILTPVEFLSGFSNDIVMTIGLMCILVRAMEVNGMLEIMAQNILTKSKKFHWQMLSLTIPVAIFSAFLNNTPIVLLMTPLVIRWAEDNKLTASKFLIPLSYAAILGGSCTIIGTSTNLAVEGMIRKASPHTSLGFFELAKVGIPCVIAGVIYLVFIGRYRIPDRVDPARKVSQHIKEFTVEFIIKDNCPFINKTIKESFRKITRTELLIQIERRGTAIDSPGPDCILEMDDRLVFVGDINRVAELHGIEGLKSAADPHFKLDVQSSHFSEIVISNSSLLIGKTVRNSNFRSNYGASVIAVYREGQSVNQNIGDIILQAGDTLMLLSGEPWYASDYYTKDFYYIRQHEKLMIFHPVRAAVVVGTLAAVVTSASLGIPIMICALAGALFVVLTRNISIREAKRGIIWNVLLLIACSFGLGRAMYNTGVASTIAESMLTIVGSNPYMLIGAIVFFSMICTELISNNAAAVLFFPIAIQVANYAGYSSPEAIKAVGVAIAFGCSCSFSMPTGYQTHMIVFGPGGYRFTDFFKAGFPLNVMVVVIATILIPNIWPLDPAPPPETLLTKTEVNHVERSEKI